MRTLTILAVLLLAGCATTGEAPDWVRGTAAAYPATDFLLGRGSGDAVAPAQERARADLAKGISVAVNAASEDVQRAESGIGAGAYSGQHEQRISTRSEALLRGVRIAELWRDPETGQQHALAVLPKLQTAQGLRREIGQRDDGLARQLAAAQAAGDPLAQLGPAERALRLAEEREALDRMLRVVDATGSGMPPAHGLARLRADRDALVARVRIAVDTSEGDDAFTETVRGALAKAGFADAKDDPAAPYRLAATFDEQDLGRQEGWHWLRASVAVVLRDAADRVRGQHSWSFKASAADPRSARQRLHKDIERVLGDELLPVIVGFAG